MAIHDRTHKPSVLSISWGGPENTWTTQALDSYDQAFQGAALLGVTVCCAAGDAGSGDQNPDDGKTDGLAHADFPEIGVLTSRKNVRRLPVVTYR